jgi:catechol 2,3-dioxygenase-like lactoylglutathione lyase family enzyme
MSAKQVARRAGISADAVKYHVENIRAKLGVSSTKSLRHRFAIPKSSPLKRGASVSPNNELAGIGQIARTVRDENASERWYREVLGLKQLYTFGSLAFFECAGVRVMLSQAQEAKEESILYLRTHDIAGKYDELKQKGIEFMDAPHMIHKHADGVEEWMVFFKDPEGRPLALMSQVGPK